MDVLVTRSCLRRVIKGNLWNNEKMLQWSMLTLKVLNSRAKQFAASHSPSCSDGDVVCALSDGSAYGSAARSWKHTDGRKHHSVVCCCGWQRLPYRSVCTGSFEHRTVFPCKYNKCEEFKLFGNMCRQGLS